MKIPHKMQELYNFHIPSSIVFTGEIPRLWHAQRSLQKWLASVQSEEKGESNEVVRDFWFIISLKVADLPIVSVTVFEAKKDAHEKAAKESEKLPTVTFILLNWIDFIQLIV